MPSPSKKPKPAASAPRESAPTRAPLWETLAMTAAFVLLWVWFGAYKSAQSAGSVLGREWTAALLVALGAMAVITVRRVQRFRRALEASQQSQRGPAPFPWMPPDSNNRN